MSTDGSDLTRLTKHDAEDDGPAWSPDGEHIAFQSNRQGSLDIFTMKADGSDVLRLTDLPATDAHPAWSPDGTLIAFHSNRDSKNMDIYVMNADGSDVTRVTTHQAFDSSPAWSPDGQQIVFRSNRDSNMEIYTVNADGSGLTRLTSDAARETDGPDSGVGRKGQLPGTDSHAAWSSSAPEIAFHTVLDDGNTEIYSVNPDGSERKRITNSPGFDGSPAWSRGDLTSGYTAEEIDVAANNPGCEETRYTFTDLGVVLTAQDAGNSDPMAPMANPSSLLLNDGRVRLFFTNAGAGIGSAISVDGITFNYEGTRVSAPKAMNQGTNLGPLRIHRLPDGRIRMFVGSSQTGVQSFVSSDEGESFTVEPGERITQSAADMLAIQKLSIISLPDGRWRGYFGPAPQHGAEGDTPSTGGPPDHWLRSAISTDLLEWSVEPGVLIGPGAHYLTASAREVFPLLRDDGCVTLFYQLNKPQDASIHNFTGVAVVGYSTSMDGLTFRKQFVLINVRDPAGPDVLRLPDRTYLMYHDSTDYAGYGHGIRVGKLEFNSP